MRDLANMHSFQLQTFLEYFRGFERLAPQGHQRRGQALLCDKQLNRIKQCEVRTQTLRTDLGIRGLIRLVSRKHAQDIGTGFIVTFSGKHRTTAFHPQANQMVGRFHAQLKAALITRLTPFPWVQELPWVFVGTAGDAQRGSWVLSREEMAGVKSATITQRT